MTAPARPRSLLVLGEGSEAKDEGLSITTRTVVDALSGHTALRVTTPRAAALAPLSELRRFDAALCLVGPTAFTSLALGRFRFARWREGSRVVLGIIHPRTPLETLATVIVARPDVTLSTCPGDDALARRGSRAIRRVPLAGVRGSRFRPPRNRQEVERLRTALGVPSDRLLVLHVGHLRHGRNLDALCGLVDDRTHVLVVASASQPADAGLRARLVGRGIDVRVGYLPAIENVYRAADVYAFPVLDPRHAIRTPLSVLEARACGIPVLSSPFFGVAGFLGDDPLVSLASPATWSGDLVASLARSRREFRGPAARRVEWGTTIEAIIDGLGVRWGLAPTVTGGRGG